MFLYKTDIASLNALRPSSFQLLLDRNNTRASHTIRKATYGVVYQCDGLICGVIPVEVSDDISTVLGIYTSHKIYAAHHDTVREMMEHFITELTESQALMSVKIPTTSEEEHTLRYYTLCGFAVQNGSDGNVLLSLMHT
jgi:hypothetical protein